MGAPREMDLDSYDRETREHPALRPPHPPPHPPPRLPIPFPVDEDLSNWDRDVQMREPQMVTQMADEGGVGGRGGGSARLRAHAFLRRGHKCQPGQEG